MRQIPFLSSRCAARRLTAPPCCVISWSAVRIITACGSHRHGIDEQRLTQYAEQIKDALATGVQIGIVIGGGNIFRGLSGAGKGFDRVKGDQMGMCATVINSLALSSALGAQGVKSRVLTAIRMEPIGEFYSKWKAIEAMERGEVAIISCGTGSPYFTTGSGSARAWPAALPRTP